MEFEWDPDKNESNIRKHGIDFERAKEIFADETFQKRSDRHGERRWIAVGKQHGRFISVVFTMRGSNIRIISARRSREDERENYRQEIAGRN